jgi:predicted permease
MSQILGLVLPFFGLIFLGFGVVRLGGLTQEALGGLNLFVVYLALPALIFQLLSTSPLAAGNILPFVATAAFGTYCAFAIAFSVGAFINRGSVPEATIQGLIGSYANLSYMGPALTIAAFGVGAALPTALIFSFETAMLVALTPLMMALGGTTRADLSSLALESARKVALNPLILATVAGVFAAATGLRLPAPVDSLLTTLRLGAAPAALFTVGASLAFRPIPSLPAEITALVAIKLIAHPLIVYLLLGWVGGFDPVWVQTAVALAALPPAAGVFALAKEYDTYVDRAATAILLGTVVSIATVTLAVILLINGLVPLTPLR